MSDFRDPSETVVATDQVFLGMKHVSNFERRRTRKKLLKIASNHSLPDKETIARSAMAFTPYFLIGRQAVLLTMTPHIGIGFAIWFPRRTEGASPIFCCWLLLVFVAIVLTGIPTRQPVNSERSLRRAKDRYRYGCALRTTAPANYVTTLIQQVFSDDHSMYLIRSLVDLGVLAESSACSTQSAIVRKFVHYVHRVTCRESEL